MKNSIYFLLCALIFSSSCATKHQDNKKFKWDGDWEWISSFGGIAGQKRTPESTEEHIMIHIDKDSIYQYVNGELKSTWSSKLHYGKLMLQNEESWYYLKNDIKVAVKIQDSILILNEDCSDCYEHRYVRKKN